MLGHAVANADGQIIAIDESVSDFMQFPRRELLHRPYHNFIHALDRSALVSAIDEVDVDGPALRFIARVVTSGASRPRVDFAISRFQSGQDEGRLVATFSRPETQVRPSRLEKTTDGAYAFARRLKRGREALGNALFVDAVLVLLTEAYIAEAEGRISRCRSALEEAELSPEVGRRWLLALADQGLISPVSSIDAPVELTDLGHSKFLDMVRCFP